MKKIITLLALGCLASGAFATGIKITFAAEGYTDSVETVIVQNLTTEQEITLQGTDTLVLSMATGIEEIAGNDASIKIIPNPVKGEGIISFTAPQGGMATIRVVNQSGVVLAEQSGYLQTGVQNYSVAGLPGGIYFVTVTGEGYSYTATFVSTGSSSGKASLVAVGTEEQKTRALKSSVSRLKSSTSMSYTTGDVLRFTGISGTGSVTIDYTPTGDTTIVFTFIAVTGISLDKSSVILAINEEYTLTATVIPNDATDKTVTWTSSDENIATVTDGKVTAVGTGNVTITAKAGNMTTVCRIIIMSTVTDIEGTTYKTVTIGMQTWMAENLAVTKYNDGTAIPNITDANEWAALTTPAFCWYNNDESTYKEEYGALYNWYAVDTASNGGKNVCPTGWHVPTDAEWTQLERYLAENGYAYDGTTYDGTETDDVARAKIAKSLADATGWGASTTTGAVGNNQSTNNSTGFSALPGGIRSSDNAGTYDSMGYFGGWLSSTQSISNIAFYCSLSWDYANVSRSISFMSFGLSVRCVRD